jgi:ribosomal protein RSM22 (predicted rRNA methylase)
MDQREGTEMRWEASMARLRALLDPMVPVTAALRRDVAAHTERYRTSGAAPLDSSTAVDAYLATRMPATMAAAGAAMRAVGAAMPRFRPRTMLDVGAGTGSAVWAATALWPTIDGITALERSDAALTRGAALAAASQVGALASARWVLADGRRTDLSAADLVTATYVLGEMSDPDRDRLVVALWGATPPGGVLLVVEAGSSVGFERVRAVRARLIAAGATIAAPCPHDGACPMVAPDWCHFGARLGRSRLHRRAKAVAAPYEDEPYAYVAATRGSADRFARVLARPDVRSGAIGLRLCTPDGIVSRVVSRRDRAAYREARHLRWGSAYRS